MNSMKKENHTKQTKIVTKLTLRFVWTYCKVTLLWESSESEMKGSDTGVRVVINYFVIVLIILKFCQCLENSQDFTFQITNSYVKLQLFVRFRSFFTLFRLRTDVAKD